MMIVDFVSEYAYGEPPPSLLLSGSWNEINELSSILFGLEDYLSVGNYFNACFFGGVVDLIFIISEDQHLLKIKDGIAAVRLTKKNMSYLAGMVESIEKNGQFNYIEFDELNLSEDANFIVCITA
jgi:hypothetical protein